MQSPQQRILPLSRKLSLTNPGIRLSLFVIQFKIMMNDKN